MDTSNSDLAGQPTFQSLIRKLYMRSHPDLLKASFPDQAKVNEASMQVSCHVPTIFLLLLGQ